MKVVQKSTIALMLLLFVVTVSAGTDWPQWRGPNRDEISKEKGLMKKWPEDGPKMLWSAEGLGVGYSAVSIAEGKIYATGVIDGKEQLTALDMKGNILWQKKYADPWKKNFESARTTPTIKEGLVYVISSYSKIVCMDAGTGEIKWELDGKKYGKKDTIWGMAESPLIAGSMVICTFGGSSSSMIALDRKTGAVKWNCKELQDKSAYCSPLLFKRGTKWIIATVMEKHIVGIDARNGKLLWKHPYKNKCSAHANTPVYGDGILVVTSGYDYGAVALKMSSDGTKASEAWTSKDFDTHHGGIILLDGYVYGSNWHNNSKGNWLCLDLKNGGIKYDTKWLSKGSFTYADGMFYCYEEKKGTVALVPATPKGFKPVSTFNVTKGSDQHWAHPVVCGGRLYIRHGDALMAYDIKAR